MQKIISYIGIYLLEIFAGKPFNVKSKPFDYFQFSAGFYYYIGSAQKNLSSRIERHLKKEKTIHWHIDHITSLHSNEIYRVNIFNLATKILECELVKYLYEKYELNFPVKHFGNSDCRNCYSHLLFSKEKINFNWKDFEIQPSVFDPR